MSSLGLSCTEMCTCAGAIGGFDKLKVDFNPLDTQKAHPYAKSISEVVSAFKLAWVLSLLFPIGRTTGPNATQPCQACNEQAVAKAPINYLINLN